MKKVEFHNQNINNIIKSELYNFMNSKNFKFINWFHSDLIFVNNKVRDQ